MCLCVNNKSLQTAVSAVMDAHDAQTRVLCISRLRCFISPIAQKFHPAISSDMWSIWVFWSVIFVSKTSTGSSTNKSTVLWSFDDTFLFFKRDTGWAVPKLNITGVFALWQLQARYLNSTSVIFSPAYRRLLCDD